MGMDLLEAIAQVESGGDDRAVGKANEISRYQLRPKTWNQYAAPRGYANPARSRAVAETHLRWLRGELHRLLGRPPTDFDVAAAWELGVAGYQRRNFDPQRLTPAQRDRAQRVVNLTKVN